MLDNRPCNVNTAGELDHEIRDIFALDLAGRDDEISGTLHVYFSDDSVKQASLLPHLLARGVQVEWHKR